MTFYVIRDRRMSRANREAWKRVAFYDPESAAPLAVVPPSLLLHWQANKEALGYAPIRGLNLGQFQILTSLAKGGKIRFGITRWGDIHSYKLVCDAG